jgi:hypothetical protein
MKIFILEIHPLLQPDKQPFPYPSHNHDYGVEQDFLIWLKKQTHLLTSDIGAADWLYLPVFWTRWYLNHNFAIDGNGMQQLNDLTSAAVGNKKNVFTICQYDGGPNVLNGQLLSFLAARTEDKQGIDIPILCKRHLLSPFHIPKKYIASFNGAYSTHTLREEMKSKLDKIDGVYLGGYLPTRFYLRWLGFRTFNRVIRSSYISICPRGTSMNSFRFFEAMQMGTAPCLLGDIDARPFKKYIPWDEFSYYAEDVKSLENIIRNINKKEALEKGKKAKQYFENEIYYQKWCKYVLMELEEISLQPVQLKP